MVARRARDPGESSGLPRFLTGAGAPRLVEWLAVVECGRRWRGERDLSPGGEASFSRVWRESRLRPSVLLVALIGLVLAGCAADGEHSGIESGVGSTSSTRLAAVTTTAVESALDAARDDVEASIRDDVAGILNEINPPDGERFVEGSVEYFAWVGDCAQRLGVRVIVTTSPPSIYPDGGGATRRDGQVIEACLDAAEEQPWFVRYPFDGSEDANRLRYRFELEIHECLRTNGYPTVDPPSEATFVSGESDWSAYAGFPLGTPLYVNPSMGAAPGSSQQLEAQEVCGASLAVLYQDQVLNGAP